MLSCNPSNHSSSSFRFNKFPKSFSTIFPSATSAFATYASISASLMLFRSIFNDLIPNPLRRHISSALSYLFRFCSDKQTIVIEQSDGIEPNHVFNASEVYLSTKISPDTRRLKVSKRMKDKGLSFRLDKGQRIGDSFHGAELKWRHVCYEVDKKGNRISDSNVVERRYFELRFKKKHRDMVLNSYLPFVLKSAEMIESEARVLKIHTLGNSHYSCRFKWESIKLEHPSTFETLALDLELKNMIVEDLNRFLRRKEFYKKVGRSWKRGYLLYGPPEHKTDSDLRKLLLDIANKSILVIEDIDCTVNLPDRPRVSGHKRSGQDKQFTLSGLLNFIDGLWSSCGDERIIVLTTNHKDRLDPALLRPGRMDLHINMSYCTMQAFSVLASNYLGVEGEHRLFNNIKELLEATKVTPAQVAEELMKNEDADAALEGFLSFLKRKKVEDDEFEKAEALKKFEKAEALKKLEIKEPREPKMEHKSLEIIPCQPE
ncbi:putative Cytochrome BC1 synthesis [Hibiscus syriacus]|uniref:Cytochrome BC1 synthesis n=1 Tax=Hibiscus syriacus TaxID=106335 RepID=A0A6A3AVJ7_HIBSY|nr:putative Cytochrome BC1 synthesis [Hibiscus syriacus]